MAGGGAVGYLIAADVRRRWRAVMLLGVVAAVGLGVPAAALAVGRRTHTAYDRFVEVAEAVDVSVVTPAPDFDAPGRIGQLPGVVEARSYAGLNGLPADEDSYENVFLTPEVVGSVDGRFFDLDRPAVIEGRLPDPDRPEEVAVSHDSPDEMRVGTETSLHFRAGVEADIGVTTAATDGEEVRDFTVVGRVRFPSAVLNDEIDTDGAGRILLTPAATAELRGFAYYLWTGVRLDESTPVADFTAALAASGDGGLSQVQTGASVRTRVERAVRPQVVALTVLAVVLGAGAVVVLATGAGLLVDPHGHAATLAILGLPRLRRALVAVAPAAIGLGVGAVGAVVVAVALSPLGPVGEMRHVEPDRGVALDGPAVLGGVAGLAAVLLLVLAAIAWRKAGARTSARTSARAAPPVATNRLLGRLGRSNRSVPWVLGARMAVEEQNGRASPTGLAMVFGNVSAVAAVAAAAVFGASLDTLVDRPERSGWDWDVFISAGGGYGILDPAGVREVAAADPDVAGWSLVGFTQVQVAGRSVPAIGVDTVQGDVRPPIAHGSSVRSGDEVVLGAVSLRQLGLEIGDHVDVAVGEERRTFRVVGSGPMPTLGTILADHPSLGVGILLDLGALQTLAYPEPAGAVESSGVFVRTGAQASGLLVRTRPGADPDTVGERLLGHAATLSPSPQDLYVQPTIQAADIRNYEEMGSQPLVIAAALVLLAIASLLLAVRSVTGRRRRDLAVLAAVGFGPRDLRRILIGHAASTLVVALALGLPLGIAAGRWSWQAYADGMGVLPDPAVPLLALTAFAAALIGLGLVLTLLPARRVRHLRPAEVLRAELHR